MPSGSLSMKFMEVHEYTYANYIISYGKHFIVPQNIIYMKCNNLNVSVQSTTKASLLRGFLPTNLLLPIQLTVL